MAFKNPSARPRAASRVRAGSIPSGVIHVNVPHAGHYVVIGNHLAQHQALSLVAIGLAVHIQSLASGTRIGIKDLTARFPEGEIRIAAALRELEAAGYLERSRVRTPEGRLVTRTVSYNCPRGTVPPPADRVPVLEPEPEPDPAPEPAARQAVDLLARLRGDDPRLLLAERDVRRLAPGVAAWLDRGAEPEAVRHALAADLPADMRSPAAVIGYRLRAGIPPRMPTAPPPAVNAARRPDPWQTCDGCERAFRAPEPGRCRDCPPEGSLAA
ncbi:helix-turn-helix domain-containing protein [Streptomyces katrae]|uniref:Helix-turn-helix domain-containing protein n=1 Tax=Streptomyces katrae TaxID=68223 RepID=A0ABT7H0H7_9ACTN|nr:helix-turn-helix domain-containing protein [Streptomyces katrae]MDK9499390.1 helix-turn-helix domain-containing protein [Streptomyces katrae]